MKLMGVDVGFSNTQPTTGIACLDGDQLSLGCAHTTWKSRAAQIPTDFKPAVIALDGPLLPEGVDQTIRRYCESVFIRAPFHNRCKPGLSDWGTGLKLRIASAEACAQFLQLLPCLSSERERGPIHLHGPLVEAFPNAFLGVMTPEEDFSPPPQLRRGQRFDWLYQRCVRTGRVKAKLSKQLDLPTIVWESLVSTSDHELRAALICLLTAAARARGTATVVGDTIGGWFWLPPWSVWESWAQKGLHRAIDVMRTEGRHVTLIV